MPQQPVTRSSLADQAYSALEHRLVTLRLQPGSLWQEKDFVSLLGIGRTPVREAVQRLSQEGLLRVLPRKGVQVTPLQSVDIRNALETQRVLERLVVVKAAERADPPQRTLLTRLAGALAEIDDDFEALFALECQLKNTLAEAADNPFLTRALQPVRGHSRRLWFHFRARLSVHDSARMHAHLADAAGSADSAGAIRALNGIIDRMQKLLKLLEEAQ